MSPEEEQLRKLIRQAHEAAADLRAATREARTTADRLVEQTAALVAVDVKKTTSELIAHSVGVELEKLSTKTDEVIKSTERLLEARIVKVVGILVGMSPDVDSLEKFGQALGDRLITRPEMVPVAGKVFGWLR